MTLVDLLNIPRVGDPQISPDGRAITFMLSTADWPANRRVAHLWRINTDGTGLAAALERAGAAAERAMVARQLHDRLPLGRQRLRDAGRGADAARQVSKRTGVTRDRVAPERRVHLFPRPRCADRCRARAAAPSRRRRRARRNAAAGTCGGWRSPTATETRVTSGHRLRVRVQDRGQRRAHHHQPPPDPAAGRLRQDGAVEHCRRRLRANPADEE